MGDTMSDVSDQPEDQGQGPEQSDNAADDGLSVGIDAEPGTPGHFDPQVSELVDDDTGVVIDDDDGSSETQGEPDTSQADEESPDEAEEPEGSDWDKQRQEKDQEIATLKKQLADAKGGDSDEEGEAQANRTTQQMLDDLVEPDEEAETADAEKDSDDAFAGLDADDDDPEWDDLVSTVKQQQKRISDLQRGSQLRSDREAMQQVYDRALEGHGLTGEQDELHGRVQAVFKDRGFGPGNLPDNSQFGDIVETIATNMELEAERSAPRQAKSRKKRKRRKKKPSTPKADAGGRGRQGTAPHDARDPLTITVEQAAADLAAEEGG